jgi:hypothetical protein
MVTRPPVRAPAHEALDAAAWLDDIERAAAEVSAFNFTGLFEEAPKYEPIVLDVIESPGARRRRLKGEG